MSSTATLPIPPVFWLTKLAMVWAWLMTLEVAAFLIPVTTARATSAPESME